MKQSTENPEYRAEKEEIMGDYTASNFIQYSDINENDVLCGRGAGTNRHVGNRRFRELVNMYQETYLSAKILEKSNIAAYIVDNIRNRVPEGRFLKVKTQGNTTEKSIWYEISDRCAKDKTSQALREKAPEVRKRMVDATNVGDFRAKRRKYLDKNEINKEQYPNILYPPQTLMVVTPEKQNKRKNPIPIVSAHGSPVSVGKKTHVVEPTQLFSPRVYDSYLSPITTQRPTSGTIPNFPSMESVIEINDNDVLCGRGGVTNSHSGNRRFRDLVKAHQPAYVTSAKLEKANISLKIVNIIRHCNPPGRFLAGNDRNGWYDVGDEKAREKTSQALRERAPEMRSLFTAAASLVDTKTHRRKVSGPIPTHEVFRIDKYHGIEREKFPFIPIGEHRDNSAFVKPKKNTEDCILKPSNQNDRASLDYHNMKRTMVSPDKSEGEEKSTPLLNHLNIIVHDNDVLYGRGAGVNYHPGNRRFRELIKAHRPYYLIAAKLEKAKIARSIVDLIRKSTPSGRFLIKNKYGAWYDVGNEKAREKASQALREKAPEIKSAFAKRVMAEQSQVVPKGLVSPLSRHSPQQVYDNESYHFNSPRMQVFTQSSNNHVNNFPPTMGSLREMDHSPFSLQRKSVPRYNFPSWFRSA